MDENTVVVNIEPEEKKKLVTKENIRKAVRIANVVQLVLAIVNLLKAVMVVVNETKEAIEVERQKLAAEREEAGEGAVK